METCTYRESQYRRPDPAVFFHFSVFFFISAVFFHFRKYVFFQEINSFESSPQVPIVFNREDSLDDFLDRILLGLYNHFRGLAGSHVDAARILRVHRAALYSPLKRRANRMNANGLH